MKLNVLCTDGLTVGGEASFKTFTLLSSVEYLINHLLWMAKQKANKKLFINCAARSLLCAFRWNATCFSRYCQMRKRSRNSFWQLTSFHEDSFSSVPPYAQLFAVDLIFQHPPFFLFRCLPQEKNNSRAQ